MTERQNHALVAALQSALVACSVFLPDYAGVFTAIAAFLPALGSALLGMVKKG